MLCCVAICCRVLQYVAVCCCVARVLHTNRKDAVRTRISDQVLGVWVSGLVLGFSFSLGL